MLRRATLTLLVTLAAGCGGRPYVPLERPRFATPAPRMVAFDVMYRRAAVLGYVYASVDPERTTFSVHSRVLGRAPRRRRPRYDPNAAARSDLFVVSVDESHVEITAVGRHVADDETLDPSLAQELAIFGEAMHRALRAAGGGLLQGRGYGGAPMERAGDLEVPPSTAAPSTSDAPAEPAGAASGLSAP